MTPAHHRAIFAAFAVVVAGVAVNVLLLQPVTSVASTAQTARPVALGAAFADPSVPDAKTTAAQLVEKLKFEVRVI